MKVQIESWTVLLVFIVKLGSELDVRVVMMLEVCTEALKLLVVTIALIKLWNLVIIFMCFCNFLIRYVIKESFKRCVFDDTFVEIFKLLVYNSVVIRWHLAFENAHHTFHRNILYLRLRKSISTHDLKCNHGITCYF